MDNDRIKDTLATVSNTKDLNIAAIKSHPMPKSQQVEFVDAISKLADAALATILTLEGQLKDAEAANDNAEAKARRAACGARLAFGALYWLDLDPSDPVHARVLRARRELDMCLTCSERNDAILNERTRWEDES